MFADLTSEARARLGLIVAIEVLVGIMAGRIFDHFVWPYPLIAIGVSAVAVLVRNQRLFSQAIAFTGSVLVSSALSSWWAHGSPLLIFPLDGVRRLLSTEWPSPLDANVIAVVGFVLAATDLVATALVLRRRWHLLPLLPLVVAAISITALSSPDGTDWPAWMVGTGFALAFALIPNGTDLRVRTAAIAGERSLAVALVAVAAVGFLGVLSVPSRQRADPRQLDDPTLTAPLVDPIEATTAMRSTEPPVELFRLENESRLIGPDMPAFWRLTALSDYDGQRWNPDSALRPIGGRLATAPDNSRLTRPPLTYTIEALTDQLDIVPFPGQPLSVSTSVNTDRQRVVVQLRERPVPGTTLTAQAFVQANRADIGNSAIATMPVDETAGRFTDLAVQLAGEGTELERLSSIESTMRGWELDPASPGAGQQLALIERFLRDTQRGTREQFASGFALLVRSLGYQSRLATGFVVPSKQTTPPVVLDTSQASVWPEVLVEDIGWIRFDPVPPTIAGAQDVEPPPQQTRTPAAPQPPIQPPAEQVDRSASDPVPDATTTDRFATLRRVALTIATYSLITIGPFALVLGGIVALKSVRRRRRLQGASPSAMVRAAWANTTDALVDAGLTIRRSDTDLQIAGHAEPLAPQAPGRMEHLAQLSTRVTFGDPTSADASADDAVAMSNEIRRAIASNMTRWRRLRWRFSLRSLLPKSRSPVSV